MDEPQKHNVMKLEVINSLDQLRENIRLFNRDADDHLSRTLNLIRSTKYWVFDEDNNEFAPSKFVGFQKMSFDRYEIAHKFQTSGASFDGSTTRFAIARLLGDYQQDADLMDKLNQWLTKRFDTGTFDGVKQSKWKFTRLISTRNYWAIACNPNRYTGWEASQILDEIAWEINQSKIQLGDRLIVWQTMADGKERGVIIVGEVIAGTQLIESPTEERQFWLDKVIGKTERIRFHVIRLPGLPIWLNERNAWLSELAVARARGGTVFTLQPHQWHQIVNQASQGEPLPPYKNHRGGQGYAVNTEAKKATEEYAQKKAIAYFEDKNYQVTDVLKNHPYDIHCQKDKEELHVEVKGTTGAGKSVILTRNEVAHARENKQRMALVIVNCIDLNLDDGKLKASGGVVHVYNPWDVDDGDLSALQYQYEPPIN